MARTPAFGLALLLPAFVVLFVAACGSGDGGGASKTATSEPPTPADAGAIRSVDLTQVPAVQTLLRQVGGGEIDKQAVIYADLTQDGRDEAVIPISSGGTLGNIAYVVLTMRSGAPAELLTALRDRSSAGGVKMEVKDGKLVKTTAKYEPEDPLCCPSALIQTTYYWDGVNLQVEREEEVKQPSPKR